MRKWVWTVLWEASHQEELQRVSPTPGVRTGPGCVLPCHKVNTSITTWVDGGSVLVTVTANRIPMTRNTRVRYHQLLVSESIGHFTGQRKDITVRSSFSHSQRIFCFLLNIDNGKYDWNVTWDNSLFKIYLFSFRPLFRGSSDVDQLGKILE